MSDAVTKRYDGKSIAVDSSLIAVAESVVADAHLVVDGKMSINAVSYLVEDVLKSDSSTHIERALAGAFVLLLTTSQLIRWPVEFVSDRRESAT